MEVQAGRSVMLFKNEHRNHLNGQEETELLTSLDQDTAAVNQVTYILSTQVGRDK